MAPKPDLSLFTVTLLLLFLTLFSFLSNATAKEVHSSNNSSPFDFLDHLKCCHKGDKVKGVHDLKKYLHKFGCLDYMNHIHSNDDHFDQFLEEAVRTYYQLNFNLNPTGTLDEKTISMMMKPHCGVPDIINGTTSMRSAKLKHQHRAIHTTVHYTLPDGDYKWPPSKYQLTFGFLPGTPSAATGSIVQAFAIWQKSTHFKFSQSNNPQNADLKISFHKRDHGDGDPFDGPGGQLAHAAYPTGGTLHYDAEETWSAGAKPGAMDYGSVGLDEIGHLLGLGHSSVEGAVMFPTVTEGVAYKGLHQDDIQGIKALYKV